MTELAWSLGVFASFVAGFGAGAFLVALGNAAGRETPSPNDCDAFDAGYAAGLKFADEFDREPSFEYAEARALRERGYVRVNSPERSVHP